MRDLFFVSVEHQCRLLARKEAGPDDSLASLAPAGMIDVRVHIGVEAVFVRRELIPKRLWLFGHEVDLRQRFGIRRSEEHTSELQSLTNLVCRLLLEKKK